MISIVISVLNGEQTLPACLDSVIEQDYESIEILVIDGASNDGTIDIISKYSKHIHYSISEPDTGVYNAWNKAVRIAKGDWVCFLGCDDKFSSKDSLRRLASSATYPVTNYVSGKVALINLSGKQFKPEGRPFSSKELSKGMKFSHPGSLHHISLFHDYGLFNEKFKIAGDYEFFLRCKNKIRSAFIPSTVVLMGDGGMSNKQQLRVFLESFRALRDSPDFGWLFGVRLLLVSLFKSVAREIIYVKGPHFAKYLMTRFGKIIKQIRFW